MEAAEARRRRLAKMKEEDEIKAAGRKGVGEWTCPYCDYANQGRLKCMNCDKERPALEQKPSVALAVLGSLLVMSAFLYFGIILVEENFAVKEMFNRLPALVLIALLILTGFQFLFFGFVLNILKEIKHRVDRLE